jgi:hypothetical protein
MVWACIAPTGRNHRSARWPRAASAWADLHWANFDASLRDENSIAIGHKSIAFQQECIAIEQGRRRRF